VVVLDLYPELRFYSGFRDLFLVSGVSQCDFANGSILLGNIQNIRKYQPEGVLGDFGRDHRFTGIPGHFFDTQGYSRQIRNRIGQTG
jgi:hypothetical protein